MGLINCCDKCEQGRRPVTKYTITAVVDEPTLTDDEELKKAGEWKGSLCAQHFESLDTSIVRAFSPPKKRAKENADATIPKS